MWHMYLIIIFYIFILDIQSVPELCGFLDLTVYVYGQIQNDLGFC